MTRGAEADRIFRALGDPTRRAILQFLAAGRRPVVEIAKRFPVSRPAISKHLRLLKEAGLVDEKRAGRKRLYGASVAALRPVGAWLEGLESVGAQRRPAGGRRTPGGAAAKERPRVKQTAMSVETDDDDDWRSW